MARVADNYVMFIYNVHPVKLFGVPFFIKPSKVNKLHFSCGGSDQTSCHHVNKTDGHD